MKKVRILKYTINLTLLFFSLSILAQEQDVQKKQDTAAYKDRYGLRLGIDLFRPTLALFDKNQGGFEILGDYRVTERFYAAGEIGYANYSGTEDYFKYTTDGSYIKLGVDFNAYKNWIGMENMIFVGFRYAFSTFNQTVDNYTINADPYLPLQQVTPSLNYTGLNATWAEFLIGIKAEILHNVFLGFAFSGGKIISNKQPDNFKNLYIPGFNRVYINENGFTFKYTLSYLIPFKRK